jgi:cold shock CspA family protein/uncharacterized LabA/DUF88 family protein
MSIEPTKGLMKIAVFYDGQYYYKVSNYYCFQHPRKRRLNISGLQAFIRHQVSEVLDVDKSLCPIVDAHYFRGRLSAVEAQGSQILFNERLFDEILMNEGIITHYLPLKYSQGKRQEKGIDVWLALEAYELAVYKRYDVVVLIACDGDYVPLVRKLSTLGTRVMLLSWDFQYSDEFGSLQTTKTSQDLLEEVTYPIAMHEIIDNRVRQNDSIINNLFNPAPLKITPPFQRPAVSSTPKAPSAPENGNAAPAAVASGPDIKKSRIKTLENGYGFIEYPPNNVFFHYSQLVNVDFNDLKIGDSVEFTLTDRDGKPNAVNVRKSGA